MSPREWPLGGELARVRGIEHHADPADLDTLAALSDGRSEDGVLHRPDATIRASRELYVARAPG